MKYFSVSMPYFFRLCLHFSHVHLICSSWQCVCSAFWHVLQCLWCLLIFFLSHARGPLKSNKGLKSNKIPLQNGQGHMITISLFYLTFFLLSRATISFISPKSIIFFLPKARFSFCLAIIRHKNSNVPIQSSPDIVN